MLFFFFSSRRRHTRSKRDWSSDVCSSDLNDIREIERLTKEKYETWEWNFGHSPDYNFKQAIKIPAGFIEVHLDVNKGYIEKAKIFGDFFASEPIEEFEAKLIGEKHDIESIKETLEKVDLKPYFGKVNLEEILSLFK